MTIYRHTQVGTLTITTLAAGDVLTCVIAARVPPGIGTDQTERLQAAVRQVLHAGTVA